MRRYAEGGGGDNLDTLRNSLSLSLSVSPCFSPLHSFLSLTLPPSLCSLLLSFIFSLTHQTSRLKSKELRLLHARLEQEATDWSNRLATTTNDLQASAHAQLTDAKVRIRIQTTCLRLR